MCKLCDNPNRPPLENTKHPIAYIVKDYIGTYPCEICLKLIKQRQTRHPGKTLDSIILKKLYLTYRNFEASLLSSAKQRMYKEKVKYILGIAITLTKEKGLRYHPTIGAVNKIIYLPVCSTLQEALQNKYDYMAANGHVQGLTQLKNKLKELSNGN